MQILVIKTLVALLGWVSLPINHRIGSGLGWTAWAMRTKLRTITEINLALCFPDWTDEKRASITRASLIETGKALTESAWIWTRPRDQLEAKIRRMDNQALFDAACAQGKGVLVVTPHLGSWEFSSLPLSRDKPLTYMYRSPRQLALEPLLIRWRANLNAQPARLDSAGIKTVIKSLRNGGNVGVLPDQEPDLQNGVFATFCGTPANTMTLLGKIARRTGTAVVFCFAERLPRGQGWHFRFVKSDPDIAHTDKELAAIALNRTVEHCIGFCPEQYLWSYKRFRLVQDGGRRDYRQP